MDEKSMILEQEHREKEKRRKKYKKLKWTVGILAVALVIGGIWYIGWGRKLISAQESTEVKIQVASGQNVVYAQIVAINGNEITYAVAEETDVQMPGTEAEDTDVRGQRGDGRSEGKSEMPDMGSMSGGMGEMPDMGSMPEAMGDMPDMEGKSGGRDEMPTQPQGGTEMQNMFSYGDTVYQVGGETVTTYIPVGTAVTTKLGTVTTFSRLSAGDCVALVTEGTEAEQVIMAVYIIG